MQLATHAVAKPVQQHISIISNGSNGTRISLDVLQILPLILHSAAVITELGTGSGRERFVGRALDLMHRLQLVLQSTTVTI